MVERAERVGSDGSIECVKSAKYRARTDPRINIETERRRGFGHTTHAAVCRRSKAIRFGATLNTKI